MPRYTLSDHPYDPELRAEYGFDPLPPVGWFVEVLQGRRVKPLVIYDALQSSYDRERPLLGALRFLVEQRFFSGDELEEALDALVSPEPVRVGKAVRRVMGVVENFKQAAE